MLFDSIRTVRGAGLWIVAVAVIALGAGAASAHPHVWVDYTVTVRFSADGPDGVRVTWAFDEMLSALIIQKYDADRDGKFSPGENRQIEKEHLTGLKDFHYFLDLKIDGVAVPVTEVKDFEARNVRGQLHYVFIVPIPRAARRDGTVDVNVTDPTFYTAFTMMPKPIAAEGATQHRVDCNPVRDPKTNLLEVLRCTFRRQGR